MNKERSKKPSEADTMRAEYDIKSMPVYRRGHGRRQSETDVLHVTIDDDLRSVFPDAVAVNEALRFLVRLGERPVNAHETLD